MLACQAAPAHPLGVEVDGAYPDKIAAVCTSLRTAMLAAGQRRYLGPILTSHAKQGDLEAALAIVRQLKEEELAATQGQRQQHKSNTATSGKTSSANGVVRQENGNLDVNAAPTRIDAAHTGADSVADQSRAAPAAEVSDGTADGEDATLGVMDSRKAWTAVDGLRHLLLYSDVDKLYRCRALKPEVQRSPDVQMSTADSGSRLVQSSGTASVSSADQHMGVATSIHRLPEPVMPVTSSQPLPSVSAGSRGPREGTRGVCATLYLLRLTTWAVIPPLPEQKRAE